MQAIILAGGKGTRLLPMTLNIPKPTVPIGGKPFLFRQIEALKRVGVKEVIISLNYRPNVIKKVLAAAEDLGVKLKYVVEPNPRGTAGAFKFAEKLIDSTTIVKSAGICSHALVGSFSNLNAWKVPTELSFTIFFRPSGLENSGLTLT